MLFIYHSKIDTQKSLVKQIPLQFF